MLVYANHISFQGPSAERLIFKAIGVWLKEQLGFGLHPVQLVQTGSFKGKRGELPSWLNICVTSEKQPEFYSWLLKTQDDHVSGVTRQHLWNRSSAGLKEGFCSS